MDRLKNDLKNYIIALYDELHYSIPFSFEWKSSQGVDYLSFKVISGRIYEINDHDDIVKKIIDSSYVASINDIYTIETGRRYQVWLYSKEKLRRMKIKKLLNETTIK